MTEVTWRIPRNVWYVLVTWGLAVVVLAGLFSFWQYRQQHDAHEQAREERAAMCKLISTIIGDTPPPEGPSGERARQVRRDLLAYRTSLHCPTT